MTDGQVGQDSTFGSLLLSQLPDTPIDLGSLLKGPIYYTSHLVLKIIMHSTTRIPLTALNIAYLVLLLKILELWGL